MSTLKNILLVVLVIASCFVLGFLHGCQMVHGAFIDIKDGASLCEKITTPLVEKQENISQKIAEEREQHRVDRAAAIVLENHEKASSGTNSQ